MTTPPKDLDEADYGTEFASSRVAGWLLRGPLAAFLFALMLLQLALWIPHYLTWPYWADHDVFATAARAWIDGRLPYRDTLCNNFPGTIYLFMLLGSGFGWGRPVVFHAFDVGLLVGFLALLGSWSKSVFQTRLPGAIAGLTFLSTYLSLDYAHAGQRDWHAPLLAAGALMFVQSGRGTWRYVAAGLACALALSTRPQCVLLVPAVLCAEFAPGRRTLANPCRIGFCIALSVGIVLLFAPLFWFGIFGDFLRSLKSVAYGGGYNRVGFGSIVKHWVIQAAEWRWWVVPAATVLLRPRSRIALPWLVMLAGVSLYKPISPVAHSYLDIPLMLVWSVNAGLLAGVMLSRVDDPPELRLAVTLLTLGLGATTLHPAFCAVRPSYRACRAFLRGEMPSDTPPGYRHGGVATTAYYPWRDYADLLRYLRETKPTTPIANMLKGDPAITAMVDHPSVFPAESVVWLRMVRRQDEPRFAEALERAEGSLVVWVPGEVGPDPEFHLDLLEAVVRRKFQFDRRFGAIEVWRRKP